MDIGGGSASNREILKDRLVNLVAEQAEGDPFKEGIVIGFAELAVAGIAAANKAVSDIREHCSHIK